MRSRPRSEARALAPTAGAGAEGHGRTVRNQLRSPLSHGQQACVNSSHGLRVRDYAISPTRFHWETQSIASVSRESGRRYIESPGNGWDFHLFVRTDRASAYAYLGPLRYLAHAGDRPIAITWELEHAMPAMLFERYATLAQG